MNDNQDENRKKKLNLEILEHRQEKILSLLHEEQRRAKEKFPLVYALLATFGLVATVTGFSKLIDKTEYLKEHPIILIIIGIAILVITGSVYNKRFN